MKFGKLDNIDLVDFSLPPFSEASIDYLQSQDRTHESPHFYIGCTGWGMKEWVGETYPKKAKAKDFLKHYGEQFNTIELNTTHYRIPDEKTIEKWKHETPDDFKFCPKIPQSISHSRDLGMSGNNIQLFCNNIRLLGQKIGCCFMQLPPYFNVERANLLQQFLINFPKDIPLSIEFRHESWFSQSNDFQELINFFKLNNIATVVTDVAGRRDVLHQEVTSSKLVVRFVGNALHPTDYSRVDRWIAELQGLFEAGLKEVYFFPHEPDNILAPRMARYVLEQAQQHLKVITRGPDLEKYREGEQMSLF
ncbi:MAG: DUF72 domain-containing protein [Bacteroidota bacterium]